MISLADPYVDAEEVDAVSGHLSEGVLSTGEVVETFEAEFAEFAGREHGAAVASGSVALELALEALDLDAGSGVVVSPFNCGAVLYALLRRNLRPVFADIDPETFNLSPASVRRAVDETDVDVSGLLVAHLYGQPSEMNTLAAVAAERDLAVIEDFAQAPGATYGDRVTGSFGDVGVCSFGATKNLTTAEGGIVVSDDDSVVEAVRRRRSNTHSDVTTPPGSVRMNDLEAAIGRVQLRKYDEILERKRRVASAYRDRLHDALTLPVRRPDRTHVYHGFAVRTAVRDALHAHLDEEGVETAAVYDMPLHEYRACPAEAIEREYPATERAADEVLLLPIHANLSREEIEAVTTAASGFFDE